MSTVAAVLLAPVTTVCACAQVGEVMEKCVTGASVLIGALGGVETAASTLTANKDAAIAEVKWVFLLSCVCVAAVLGA